MSPVFEVNCGLVDVARHAGREKVFDVVIFGTVQPARRNHSRGSAIFVASVLQFSCDGLHVIRVPAFIGQLATAVSAMATEFHAEFQACGFPQPHAAFFSVNFAIASATRSMAASMVFGFGGTPGAPGAITGAGGFNVLSFSAASSSVRSGS